MSSKDLTWWAGVSGVYGIGERKAACGHAFVQNLRRGDYEFGVDADPGHQLPAASTELAHAI